MSEYINARTKITLALIALDREHQRLVAELRATQDLAARLARELAVLHEERSKEKH